MSLIGRLLGNREQMQRELPCEVFLREQQVPFSVHHHAPAFSAQRLAKVEHVPGRMVMKVVIVMAADRLVMLCLPAICRVNMLRVMDAVGTDDVRLAREGEFAAAFPDCEIGAMPPIGNLYRMPVIADRLLLADDRIIFPAGTHTETFEMAYTDFARIVRPMVADLCSSC